MQAILRRALISRSCTYMYPRHNLSAASVPASVNLQPYQAIHCWSKVAVTIQDNSLVRQTLSVGRAHETNRRGQDGFGRHKMEAKAKQLVLTQVGQHHNPFHSQIPALCSYNLSILCQTYSTVYMRRHVLHTRHVLYILAVHQLLPDPTSTLHLWHVMFQPRLSPLL